MTASVEVCRECVEHCTLCGNEVLHEDNDRCDRCIAAYFESVRGSIFGVDNTRDCD